jgi:hypothetical protein
MMEEEFKVETVPVLPRNDGVSGRIRKQLSQLQPGESILIPLEMASKGLHQMRILREELGGRYASKRGTDGLRIGRV